MKPFDLEKALAGAPVYSTTGYENRLAALYTAIIGGQVASGRFNVREAKEAALMAMEGLEELAKESCDE